MKPLAIDLCCGLGGWTEGLLAEGWDVVGFDIERHAYGSERYPAQLVIQDIMTLTGHQFRGKVDLIVASPPCQFFSYCAMPWTRAKALAATVRADPVRLAKERALFDACVRIGREAECPIVIENVRGAQPWVGKARANYGSFYLWGQVPILMPRPHKARKGRTNFHFHAKHGLPSPFFHGAEHEPSVARAVEIERATKNEGGSWFAVAHNTTSGHSRNPVHRMAGEAVKQADADGYERTHPQAFGWKNPKTGPGSSARKAASARIAKIPARLSAWIARYYFPESAERAS